MCRVLGKTVGFPSPVSLTMTLLDFPESSPRSELKIMVPRAETVRHLLWAEDRASFDSSELPDQHPSLRPSVA